MADAELAQKLARRQHKIEESSEGLAVEPSDKEKSNGHPAEEISGSTGDELRGRLTRRQEINEGRDVLPNPVKVVVNVYTEFHEFTRKQIKSYEAMFKRFDLNKDGFICFEELKLMMEKLGAPQTHLALKEMIKEVDEDQDKKINLREFLLIFRKAAAGELLQDSGLSVLAQLSEIDVAEAGVGGAKEFFEAKIDKLTKTNAFEQEIREEQEEKRRQLEEKKQNRQAFQSKQALFGKGLQS